jgi:hypothetical protein
MLCAIIAIFTTNMNFSRFSMPLDSSRVLLSELAASKVLLTCIFISMGKTPDLLIVGGDKTDMTIYWPEVRINS